MDNLGDVFKCNICGHIIEIIHQGAGELVCCGQPMILKDEQSQELGREKHLPVIQITPRGVLIKIGEVPHPMEPEHYIEWIEIIADGEYDRKFLKPGDQPEAIFQIESTSITARAYCNVHGLWKI